MFAVSSSSGLWSTTKTLKLSWTTSSRVSRKSTSCRYFKKSFGLYNFILYFQYEQKEIEQQIGNYNIYGSTFSINGQNSSGYSSDNKESNYKGKRARKGINQRTDNSKRFFIIYIFHYNIDRFQKKVQKAFFAPNLFRNLV